MFQIIPAYIYSFIILQLATGDWRLATGNWQRATAKKKRLQ